MNTLWLVASNSKTGERRWFQVGQEAQLSGAPALTEPNKVNVDIDQALSRRHFHAVLENGHVRIRRADNKHALYLDGAVVEDFLVSPGQHFTSAQTVFRVVDQGAPEGEPTTFFTLSADILSDAREQHANRCLQALLRVRPLLNSHRPTGELFAQLLPLLLEVLPEASCVLCLSVSEDGSNAIETVQSAEDSAPPVPSKTLLRRAVLESQPAGFVWTESNLSSDGPTAYIGVRWALAAPIRDDDEDGRQHVLYAIGSEASAGAGPGALDQAVMALVADMIGDDVRMRRRNKVEGQMAQFFSPGMRSLILRDPDHSLLKLRVQEVTALFLDLRGFSRATEEAQRDEARWEQFQKHFEDLTSIMTGVTERIFETDGIVVDFQGDAVFGAWGAPIAQDNHAERAVRTASAMMRWLTEHDIHPLGAPEGHHLPCGIGISSGRILGGNVGMAGQIKYQTVGRCINEASRLEGLTKYFKVPVLMTGSTRAQLPADVPTRRVGRVRPAGMDQPIELFELVLPSNCAGSGLTAEQVHQYEVALSAFEAGAMDVAEETLLTLPRLDPVRRFLQLQVSRFLLEGIPKAWDGVITFTQK